MATENRWRAWHLHLPSRDVVATDRVITQVVGPAVDTLREPWFFIRYWQYGPHVRLRVANLDPERGEHLDALLRGRLGRVPTGAPLSGDEYRRRAAPLAAAGEAGSALEVGELWPPGVYQHLYQPEVDRYGGAALLAGSEALFQVASELALAFLRREPPEAARSGLGLQATRAALRAVAAPRRLGFCRRAAAGWQEWAARAGHGEGALGKGPALPPRLPPGDNTAAPVRRWSERLTSSMARWRDAIGEERAERILHAHIHMLHNRLGLSVGHEYGHYQALAASLRLAVPVGAA